MLRIHHSGPGRPPAAVRRAWQWSFIIRTCIGAALLSACHEPVGPLANAARVALPVASALPVAAGEPGIGGSYFMEASGDAVTPVDLQGTGIRIPVGTEVEVEIGGSILRAHTPGLVQFCELPHMRPRCLDAWADILRETPLLPSGASGPRAMVSWDGGAPVYPDSGSSRVLVGPAGGELWAGRNGLQCWYVDHVTGIQGACFAFSGGYLVTVRPRSAVAVGGGGVPAGTATITLDVVKSNIGPAGGSADLALRVATAPDSAPEPRLGDTRWYFVPDTITVQTGTPVPSPFEVRASHSAGAAPALPQRLDAERVRLPDGRIVGSGIYLAEPSAASGAAAGGPTRRSATPPGERHPAGSWATMAVDRATTSYPECDGEKECHAEFDAPSGTLVVSTTLGGVPVSASARVGVVGGGQPARIDIVRVAGPNPGGSFTTRENEIALEAQASPGYSGSIAWEFRDDPDDQVESPYVMAGEGATTVATVGPWTAGRGRWPEFHPGRLDQKAFRYIVRAHATYGGTRIYSEPVVLEQQVVDVIRQEYIDYEVSVGRTPGLAAFTRALPEFAGVYQFSPTSETGLGDYCVTGGKSCTTLVSERLAPFLTWLGGAWKHQPLVATSIFRNPVHHHGHMRARNDSPHKYGTAVDYDVTGVDRSLQQRLHWTALRNTGLRYPGGGVCAETWYLGTSWAGDHVHFDRRDAAQRPCTDSWKVHEDVMGQQSVGATGGSTPDTLVAMLRSEDFDTRFAAAGALASMPGRDLPTGYAEAAVQQLDVEVARRTGATGSMPGEYGAYLLELARVVHRGQDPAAVRVLAWLGIDMSLGIRRFVARFPSRGIPALENVWNADASLHADVIGTYGEMLRFHADSGFTLAPDALATIDRAFVRAAGGSVIGQWGIAFHVGQLGLVEYAPLLEILAAQPASPDDPSGLVAAAAVQASLALQPSVAAASAAELMGTTVRLQQSICAGADGQRLGQCTAMASTLGASTRALEDGSHLAASAALEAFRGLLSRAAGRGIFTALEHRLLDANATALIRKLT